MCDCFDRGYEQRHADDCTDLTPVLCPECESDQCLGHPWLVRIDGEV